MPAMPVRTSRRFICNSLGKDLSGQGMHTKTIGRSPYGYQQGKPWKSTMPAIYTIVGSRLSIPDTVCSPHSISKRHQLPETEDTAVRRNLLPDLKHSEIMSEAVREDKCV
jgi:hypothetical protein